MLRTISVRYRVEGAPSDNTDYMACLVDDDDLNEGYTSDDALRDMIACRRFASNDLARSIIIVDQQVVATS